MRRNLAWVFILLSAMTANAQSISGKGGLSVRANLLRWATLTPDVGIEWNNGGKWSVLANASYTSWSWNNKDRRYGLWEISPEVRLHLGENRKPYIGAMLKGGSFNYKFSKTGKQGDLFGGGLTGGYVIELGKQLDIDFSIGLGYLHADFDKYYVADGVRMKCGEGSKNYWGVINAGISLVYNIK